MEQTDPPKDGDPSTDHQWEHEESANAFASLIFSIRAQKTRLSTKFVKKLDDILEISLPPNLPRHEALSRKTSIGWSVYRSKAIPQIYSEMDRKKLDFFNHWENLHKIFWKRVLYLPF